MSAPLRFVAVVVLGWTGVRAMTLGAIPGFTVGYAKEPSRPMPPIAQTQFPPLPPLEMAQAQAYPQQQLPPQSIQPPSIPAGYYGFSPYPAFPVAASRPIPPRPQWRLPVTGTAFAEAEPADWQFATLPAFPGGQSRPVQPLAITPPPKPRLDRLQLTSWALLRGAPQPGSLAPGGTLGGSQAGARLTYNFNRWLAASVRTTSPLGGARRSPPAFA